MPRPDTTAEGLRVAIGFPSAVMLVMGGIVGVGIFVNPAVVARGLHSPTLVLAAWTLGGVIALLGAFVYAELAARMPAMRVLVNTPAPQGSTGITTNVFPSMTLGCGAAANNSTSDNVGPLHLINIKRLAFVARTPEEAFEMPLDYDKAQDGPVAAAVSDIAAPSGSSVCALSSKT